MKAINSNYILDDCTVPQYDLFPHIYESPVMTESGMLYKITPKYREVRIAFQELDMNAWVINRAIRRSLDT